MQRYEILKELKEWLEEKQAEDAILYPYQVLDKLDELEIKHA